MDPQRKVDNFLRRTNWRMRDKRVQNDHRCRVEKLLGRNLCVRHNIKWVKINLPRVRLLFSISYSKTGGWFCLKKLARYGTQNDTDSWTTRDTSWRIKIPKSSLTHCIFVVLFLTLYCALFSFPTSFSFFLSSPPCVGYQQQVRSIDKCSLFFYERSIFLNLYEAKIISMAKLVS